MIDVALVVGHSRKNKGARNERYGITEFAFNSALAQTIEHTKRIKNLEVVYRESYKDLPTKINALNPKIILSLHCNAFNTIYHGCEMLYWNTSEKGKALATITQKCIVERVGLRDRNIKPRHKGSRGAYLLRRTNAPCIICEPFFIDNDEEYKYVWSKVPQLIDAYIYSIQEGLTILF